jgi:hypothetical protein
LPPPRHGATPYRGRFGSRRLRRQTFRQRPPLGLARLDAGVELARLVEFEGAHRQVVLVAQPGQLAFNRGEPGSFGAISSAPIMPQNSSRAEVIVSAPRYSKIFGFPLRDDSTGLRRRDSVSFVIG